MARSSDAKNASNSTAPAARSIGLSLLALMMALAPSAPADPTTLRAQSDGMAAGIRRRIRRLVPGFGGDTGGQAVLTGLIELLVGFVVLVFCILIAFLLLPLVNGSSAELSADENTTDQQRSVLPVVGLILIVCIIIMALGFLFAGFRNLVDSFKK